MVGMMFTSLSKIRNRAIYKNLLCEIEICESSSSNIIGTGDSIFSHQHYHALHNPFDDTFNIPLKVESKGKLNSRKL